MPAGDAGFAINWRFEKRAGTGLGIMYIGNGWTNVLAAAIIALAIVWTGGFGGKNSLSEEDYAAWTARAVGDIRNDIVVNCGCCGDGAGNQRRAAAPF